MPQSGAPAEDDEYQEDGEVEDDEDEEQEGEEDFVQEPCDENEDEIVDQVLQQLEKLQEVDEVPAEPAEGAHGDDLQEQAEQFVEHLRGAEERAIPVPEVSFPTPKGELRYNISGKYFMAYCRKHEYCHRQRTSRASQGQSAAHRGQGRPLGALYAWLCSADEFRTREQHMKARVANLATRQSARRDFLNVTGAPEFSTDCERAKEAEEPDEPPSIR